jgi:hypothetical protein
MKKKIASMIVGMLVVATFVHITVLGNGLKTDTENSRDVGPFYSSQAMGSPRLLVEPQFSQLDWYYLGDPLTLNSLWGQMEIIAQPGSAFWYMNVVADAGFGPAWVIQNYPIFPVQYGVPDDQMINFNLQELGLHEGMQLQTLSVIIAIDQAPQTAPPQGQPSPYDVHPTVRDAWGHTIDPPGSVGMPPGHQATVGVNHAVKHINTTASVQEAKNNCITGAYARSIKWLDNIYDLPGLPAGKTAQDVYDDLNKSGVGQGSGQGLTEQQMLERKAAYLKGLDGNAVTKFVDLTGWMNNSVKGCTEENPANLADWLMEELKTEDVEVCYDHHCIMLTGMYTQGDKTFLEYRDDEKQGNATAGDTAEKEGQLTKVGNAWQFDGSGVDYVVSESINKAPNAPTIDGPTSGKPGVKYDFTLSATDPDGNKVMYFVDWGDGTQTNWTGPNASGAPVILSHTFLKKGTYIVKGKAKDIYGNESDWGTLQVKMPITQQTGIHSLLERILARFPHAFPILRYLFGL